MSRKKKHARLPEPQIRLVGWDPIHGGPRSTGGAAGIATALASLATATIASSTASAAPGDLDPTFGDLGRQQWAIGPAGTLWSLEPQDDDSILFGGGDHYCGFYDTNCHDIGLAGRLLPNGAPDAAFAAAILDDSYVYDMARQSDGKVVAVGTSQQGTVALVFRLRTDGSLDPTFGTGGTMGLPGGMNPLPRADSVLVESDGQIVVAASYGNTVVITRLESNGALDSTFGEYGQVTLTASADGGSYPARVVAAPSGGYRVMLHRDSASATRCHIAALTESGAFDATFGDDGIAPAPVPVSVKDPVTCSTLAVRPDGALLLGGARGAGPYVGRALANGSYDSTFNPASAIDGLTEVTALAFGNSGGLYVAGPGTGLSGATVVRLTADGTLDSLFGSAGKARFQLNQPRGGVTRVREMKSKPDGSLTLVGDTTTWVHLPFVARLLGDGAGGGPGVLSADPGRVYATEASGEARVHIERIGGSEGAVSVSYVARPWGAATEGSDFSPVSGRLQWSDGDTAPKEIVVPVLADTVDEGPETFEVFIESPEGGAGLGVTGTAVEIAGLGYPAGSVSFWSYPRAIGEGGLIQLSVGRNDYAVGAISVTLRIAGGSAEVGKDVASSPSSNTWTDVVLTWADGDSSPKEVTVATFQDKKDDGTKTVDFELANPTGGVMLGTQSKITTYITNTTPRNSGGGGGGGSFGALGALLAGLAGLWRRLRVASPSMNVVRGRTATTRFRLIRRSR